MFVKGINLAPIRAVQFGRKLTNEEEIDYRNNAIKPALDYLGTKDVVMIIHGTCFPEAKKDIGVGSPYGTEAENLIKFEMLHGFNGNQLGPSGVIRDAQNRSPYQSTVSTKNYLFIDFKELTKDKYANLLTDKDINTVFNDSVIDGEIFKHSSFSDAFANYKYLIHRADKNFKNKLAAKDPQAILLNKEFEEFKKNKGNVVYNEALFSVMEEAYGTDNFRLWDDIDKNLVKSLNEGNKDAIARYKKFIKRSNGGFEDYIFAQFLIDKQVKENSKFRHKLGFKNINDLLVGFANSDEWANQDLFLENYRMGCPYGGKYGPQLWDIPVLNPKKFFNSDGSLGPAGIYLKKKLDDALEDCDNIRIDHALGLVDPYIYDVNSIEIAGGKIDLSRFNAGNISTMPNLDPDGNYKKLLSKIILPTLEEHGLDKDSPVWEDLVTETPVFNQIYHNEHNLPGITQLEYKRGENFDNTRNWGLIGSHDSDPAINMIKKDWVKKDNAWNIFYLAGFLNSNPKRAAQRDEFCHKIDNNDLERVKAKFAELFLTCKKIQISFADMFGINERYNVVGEENNTNWKTRLSENFEDVYYKNLSSKTPTALNMPEILKMAVQAKSDLNNVKKAHEQGLTDENISKENSPEVQKIVDNLDKYEKILKTPD